jgi:hypothetical protein
MRVARPLAAAAARARCTKSKGTTPKQEAAAAIHAQSTTALVIMRQKTVAAAAIHAQSMTAPVIMRQKMVAVTPVAANMTRREKLRKVQTAAAAIRAAR